MLSGIKALEKWEKCGLLMAKSGPLKTNSYFLVCNHKALLIDAPPSINNYVKELISGSKVHLKYVFITHGHFDHIADASPIHNLVKADIVMHRLDLKILDISRETSKIFGVKWAEPRITILMEGERNFFSFHSLVIEAILTPGHTPGSVVYYIPKLKIAFTGDTLFKGKVGATHFPGGSKDDLIISLRKLIRELPSNAKIYPGHGSPTTMIREVKHNEFIRREINQSKQSNIKQLVFIRLISDNN